MPRNIGRYVLVRELGRGAMARVFLARDPFAGGEVAVKVFTQSTGDPALMSPAHRHSLLNEAALIGKLKHPHIVAVLDAAVDPELSYLVMEYVPGSTLSRYTTPDNLLPLERVVEIVFKLSRALDFAHRQGVIHRDVKPANVLVTHSLDVKLSDFGIARLDNTTHTDIANAGSPAYMSPEQVKGEPLTQQTDIYSLGVVMYQLLCGRPPFVAESSAALMYQVVTREPPRLRKVRSDLPEGFEAIVSRAMHKDRIARYENWVDFGKDLARLTHGVPEASESLSERRKFEALRDLSFFRDFREVEIWETLRLGNWRRLPGDTVIMDKGERGDALYIVVEGRVEVSRAGTQLATLAVGDLFGEMLYFAEDTAERSTTVRSTGPVLLLEMSSAALRAATGDCQVQFNRACIRLLIKRLSVANRRLVDA